MTELGLGRGQPLEWGLLGWILAALILLTLAAQPAGASEGSSTTQATEDSAGVAHGQAGLDDASIGAPAQVPADPAGDETGAPPAGEPASGPPAPVRNPALGPMVEQGAGGQPADTAPEPQRSGVDASGATVDAQRSSTEQIESSSGESALSTSSEPSVPIRRTLQPVAPTPTAVAGPHAVDDSTTAADATALPGAPGRRDGDEGASSEGIGAFQGPIGLAALLTSSAAPAERASAATQAGEERSRRPAEAGEAQRPIPAQPMMPDGDIETSSASGNGAGSAGGGHSVSCDESSTTLLVTAASCILRPASVTAWQLLRDRRGQPHPD